MSIQTVINLQWKDPPKIWPSNISHYKMSFYIYCVDGGWNPDASPKLLTWRPSAPWFQTAYCCCGMALISMWVGGTFAVWYWNPCCICECIWICQGWGCVICGCIGGCVSIDGGFTAGHEGWTIEGVIVCDNVGIIECVDETGPTLWATL